MDDEEEIDALPFSTADTEEDALNGHDFTTDAAKGIETQALSPANAEESVRACDNSTDEDGEEIGTQALSPADDEEEALNGHDSTTSNEEEIDAQAFSTAGTEEEALNGHDSTTDAAKDIGTQALSIPDAVGSLVALPFSTDKGRWGVRSPRGPDPPTDDGHAGNAIRHAGNDTGNDFSDTGNDFADAENHFTAQPSNFSADRHSPAAVGTAHAADPAIFAADECRSLRTLIEKHPYLNPSFHEPHPLLRLHPPSFGRFGRTFRVQSAQPPFGRPFLGRFVDIRPACTVGSRPLRPRLARGRPERGRCRPEHTDRERTTSANAPEHGAQCAKNADFIDADPARGHQTDRNAPEHDADGRKRHDPAPEHPANAAERFANAVSTPVDEPEHGARRAKIADFIDADPARGHKTERNAVSPLADAGEHADCGRKTDRDECPDPAYDLDAGQRVLRSAAHRRAVRAEREACCGALRHLAHCCVAF